MAPSATPRHRRAHRGARHRLAVGVSVAALATGAAACSSTTGATKASLADANAQQSAAAAIRSLGAGPNLQLDVSLSGSRLGGATKLADALHLVVDSSSTDGTTALSAAGSAVASEIRLESGSTSLVDLIETGPSTVFVRVDPLAVLDLPVPFTSAQRDQIRTFAPFVGDRWFSLPPSLLNKAAAGRASQSPAGGRLDPTRFSSLEQSLRQAVLGALDFKKGSPPPGGGQLIVVSGTLKALVDAVIPVIDQGLAAMSLSARLPVASIDTALSQTPVELTGDLSLDDAGTLTTLAVSSAVGAVAVRLTMDIAHADVKVAAPVGAVALPASLISALNGLHGLGTLGLAAGSTHSPLAPLVAVPSAPSAAAGAARSPGASTTVPPGA